MLPIANLLVRLSSFAVIEPYFPVRSNTHQCIAVWTELSAVYIIVVLFLQLRVELEGRAMVEDHTRIIAASSRSKRSLLSYGDRVDL